MNRKKLARRTALASKINHKWVFKRGMERLLIDGFAAFFAEPGRTLELLSANNVFVGGRVIRDNITFEV